MRRRDFIAGLGGAAAAWPIAARAQQTVPVIGFLNSTSRHQSLDRVRAFQQGLGESGYTEGRNVAIEYRWADGQYDSLPALAADLVRRRVALIVATGGLVTARVAKAATSSIPVVFQTAADPVQVGLVESLNRPGANLTGITSLNVEVGPKRLQILHELLPGVAMIAMLVNPKNPSAEAQARALRTAAVALDIQVHVLHASADRDFDAVFPAVAEVRAGGLVIGADAVFNVGSERLAALTNRHMLPTITQYREFATAGGLMSYGGGRTDSYRLAGVYAGRILKGEKPADLPVQQATKAELTINIKTAKSLGLNIPLALLGRADEVIE